MVGEKMDNRTESYSLGRINHFRFWCNKVLPAVYDDSLTYYELLCKVVKYLNDVIDACNNNSEAIEKLARFLDEANIQEMVRNVLDEMVEDGTMDEIINEEIFAELNDKIEYLFDQNVNYRGWAGWDVTTNGEMYTASRAVKCPFDNTSWEQSELNENVYFNRQKFISPIAMEELHFTGTCDESPYIAYANGFKHYGIDVRAYSFYNKNTDYPTNAEYYIRAIMHGRRYTFPEECQLAYSESAGEAIANVAKSYYNAMLNGRNFAYGANFFYVTPNNIVNDSNGYGRMECDTFVGLCLRGMTYDNSPYTNLTPNFQYSYNDMYLDVSEATEWESGNSYLVGDIVEYGNNLYKCVVANNDSVFSSLNFSQIWVINQEGYFNIINQTLHPINPYLGRDIRFASDQGVMGLTQETAFTDQTYNSTTQEWERLHTARTGDIAVWRRVEGKPVDFSGTKNAPGFDNIAHVGVLSIEGGTEYIYHVSSSNHTHGHIVDRVPLDELGGVGYPPPDYFVRARYVDPVIL